ncbi:hypothetical protein Tcan_02669 [Toxocara canis]|uniref:Uncharacterized protein n=1 Tax=Toxocara canis TaxID=6265 RepID=A0A0B2W0Z6_TOXCA|nr:hypothetical protein Tcan_02669 [Toxocara canis]
MASVYVKPLLLGSLKRACVVTSLRDDIRWLSSTSGEGQQLAPNREFNMIISDEYDGFAQFQSLLKIGQRFKRDPTTWPQDELPFGMTHANFIGKTMHQIELRPERAFANFVPMRLFAFRHLGRMLRARLFHKTFRKYEIFDQRAIIKGARRAFELISQSIYKNELHDLVERNICSVKTIQRFSEAMHEMTPRQHDLLDLSQDDIVSIAPGVLGPFQNIRQVLRENVVHLTYSILCCAFYRKKILYDANELHDLVERNICSVKTIQRFSEAMHEMTPRQHDLLDLSQDDIVSIAPGVLGPFQNIRQVLRENVVHLTYSILCCAFYRKKILYDAVEKLPLLEPNDVKEDSILAIPSEYGYAAPRLVFGYMDFSHLLDTSTRKVDPTVNLFDFQFVIM